MKKFETAFLFLILITSNSLFSQEKIKITSTNLKISLLDDFVSDGSSAIISNQDYGISFIEMAGVNYFDQLEDFNDIESEYALKGISVKKKNTGKINNYDAIFITLESKPAIYQVFFGNSKFCAVANVSAVDSIALIDEAKINSILNTIEYHENSDAALKEHANFSFKDKNEDWVFQTYIANGFGFENKNSEDFILLLQLPPEALVFATKEFLGKQFVTKLKEKIPEIKIAEEGSWKTNNLEGYRILVNVSEKEDAHLSLIYLFVFQSKKSSFVFQGMGRTYDAKTEKLFEAFLNNLILKK